jgi:hypothetical protein
MPWGSATKGFGILLGSRVAPERVEDPMLPDNAFVLSEQVNWRDIKGETVVLNIESGVFYTLNEVGRSIWEMVANGHTFEAITHQLSERFEVSPNISRTDAEKFLQRLMDEGILKIAEQQ